MNIFQREIFLEGNTLGTISFGGHIFEGRSFSSDNQAHTAIGLQP